MAAALVDAKNGKGTLVCLCGEAGIGKTRTAEEAANMARAGGIEVHYGSGYDGAGSPPYWLWAEVVRSLMRDRDPSEIREQAGASAAFLSAVLPEAALGGDGSIAESDGARFQVFDAVTRLIVGESRRRTLVVVLDDVHWADPASLRLLSFFAREVGRAPLLVVANTRSSPEEDSPVLQETLASLARHDWVHRFELRGLDAPDVDALIRDVSGGSASERLVEIVRARTEGNPFFVKEMVRFLATSEGEGASMEWAAEPRLPHSVRGLVERRLRALPDSCVKLLRLAAVVGQEPDLRIVAKAADLDLDTVRAQLEPAMDASLVALESGWRVRFPHPLVHDTLVLQPTRATRAELHLAVATTLEEEPSPPLSALATHFSKAPPAEAYDRAIEYGLRAAYEAIESLAFEDAVRLLDQAVAVVESREKSEPSTRADLLLARAAALRGTGDLESAHAAAFEAASIAREAGDSTRLGRAALLYSEGQFVIGMRVDGAVSLLEEAAAALGADDPARVRVLAALATFSLNPQDYERAEGLIQEALAGAHRLGDEKLLITCLTAQLYVLWAPGNADQRITTAEQILRRSEAARVPGSLAFARNARTLSFLEKRDLDRFETSVDEVEAAAVESRDAATVPGVIRYRATRAMLEGRLVEAERLCQEGYARGSELGMEEVATMSMAALTFMIRQHQGRLAELEPLFKPMVAKYSEFTSWTIALSLMYVELDRADEVRRIYDSLVHSTSTLPRDPNWLSAISVMGQVCAYLRDHERAPSLYGLLAPYADSYVVIANGDSVDGSVSRVLGQLAAVLERWDAAERHFETALEHERAMGARPYVVQALLAYAEMLLERSDEGDHARAEEHLKEAEELAQTIGMARALERIEALRRREEGSLPPPAPSQAAAREPARSEQGRTEQFGVFRDEGDYWTVGLGGNRTRLRRSRGLEQIARLLREPGREFHALDLTGQLPDALAATGDLGSQLDARSRTEIARRLEELRDSIAEAEENGDPTRAAILREEVERIASEVARNVGLGGRSRRSAGPSERARVNATRTIARTIRKIAEVDESLARALTRTIRTGTFCVYQPDLDLPIEWHFG